MWGTRVEIERHRRIKVAVGAYAYEYMVEVILTDAQYDKLASKIDLTIKTGHKVMDNFFRTCFQSHTGQWVHMHPEKEKLAALCKRILERM